MIPLLVILMVVDVFVAMFLGWILAFLFSDFGKEIEKLKALWIIFTGILIFLLPLLIL